MSEITQSTVLLSAPVNTSFRVVPRTRGDDEVIDVAAGRIGDAGTTSFALPPGYYVVFADGFGATPLHVGDSEVIEVTLAPTS